MTGRFYNLRFFGNVLLAASFLAGAVAVFLWTTSTASWNDHRTQAYLAGVVTFYAMQNQTAPAAGVHLRALSGADIGVANAGRFRQVAGAPPAARITSVPILADAANPLTGQTLQLSVLSPDLTYRLAALPHRDGQTAAETLGEIFHLLASYCSDPFVLAKYGDTAWVQVDGGDVWNCDAAPADRRLMAVSVAVLAIGMLGTTLLNLSAYFTAFADQLWTRRRLGGPKEYDTAGPGELQSIVGAVNHYLKTERDQLANRAAVLSGVSHDLGTPAARLRLRAALIDDDTLRGKLESDIDQMTGIIESVLTYTQAEMNVEEPRKLSLTSLVDAIVDDYRDVGRSVTFRQSADVVVQGGRSVFMSRQGQSVLSDPRPVTVSARPVSLQRAITNLIDNALKYGRRATVSLETDANTATIVIQDEGSDTTAADIQKLMAPFQRGGNTATIDGHGLGLTIVSTIAKLHGGTLDFEDSAAGLTARLTIQRG